MSYKFALVIVIAGTLSGVLMITVPAKAENADPDVGLRAVYEREENTEVSTRSRSAIVRDTRAVTVISQQTLEELAPRSTPEALLGAAGVSVQKTNHAGGSPYIRGTTGQQTLILIDGFRLNTSIARSGPNQYLNTIDPLVLGRIEVLRGSGSVLYGSDAIGGVVNLITRQPRSENATLRGTLRGASADRAASGRAEADLKLGGVGTLVGFGGRHFGNLRGGGAIEGTAVPVYNGKEQRFTGYSEASGNAKVLIPVGTSGTLTTAALMLRQLNAPRTDKCKSELDCRYFDEQFYDIGYVKYDGEHRWFHEVSMGAAVLRTREKRRRIRENKGRTEFELDEVLGLGFTGRASVPTLRWDKKTALRISYGAESYVDFLSSQAHNQALGGVRTTPLMRGKYLDDSSYISAASFSFAELTAAKSLSLTGGFRLGVVRANIAADPEAGTGAFSQNWMVPVASLGARVALTPWLALVGNIDQGFRAPNLDDLTARSDEGPGFQIANPTLDPETSLTMEGGLSVEHPSFRAGVFAYQTKIDDFIGRKMSNCPSELEEQCSDSENVFVLENADSAQIEGVEGTLEISWPIFHYIGSVSGNLTYTRGTRQSAAQDREPLSKIPPLHGRVSLKFHRPNRYFVAIGGSFADAQERLSPQDKGDPRIPEGGTSGYLKLDASAGIRLAKRLHASIIVDNLTDEAYRIHGSGVDGAGFGVIVKLSGALSP